MINTAVYEKEKGMTEYTVRKVSEPVPLEWSGEDGVWASAEEGTLREVVSGGKPRLATRFRMLYSEENLYVFYEVEDRVIFASYTDHDYPLYEEDVVELFLSPSGSLHYYYEFNFSPRAVAYDAIVLNDGGPSETGRGEIFIPLLAWDCEGLQVKAHRRDGDNWSVGAAVPFRQLHLAENRTPRPGETWRANLFRIEYGEGEPEYSAWIPTGVRDFHVPVRFGTLRFA